MGLFSRFFGKKQAPDDDGAVANRDLLHPLSLQVLFERELPPTGTALQQALREYTPALRSATWETDPQLVADRIAFGLIGWDEHVVKVVGFDAPMPAEAVEACVAGAHYPQQVKQRARHHRAHVLLYYAGRANDPVSRYCALALVAGGLSQRGGVAVTNEAARMSVPAELFGDEQVRVGGEELLRSLLLLHLFCGFVKLEVEGQRGVWMRTYGGFEMGLPDFAFLAEGHQQGTEVFGIFESVFGYLLDSRAELAAGHTMQVGDDLFMRVRSPAEAEPWLATRGPMLVAEFIPQRDIVR